ncbi:hypothetical protein AQUCO_01000735v1 [Aquilegia coerulea]|uniref:Uncharacterized protein n=1 Tax=Aquilegia coerulea TaxID=218851 RepID=A0A2G5EBC2_AQUCA|nr:hypothetical protein AQUCO_01000735v1 [Aquilegia coerulea]
MIYLFLRRPRWLSCHLLRRKVQEEIESKEEFMHMRLKPQENEEMTRDVADVVNLDTMLLVVQIRLGVRKM